MITWTVNCWWTHILSVLQEVLQVSVVSELFWHLLDSSFVLVMPEGQTQNGEKSRLSSFSSTFLFNTSHCDMTGFTTERPRENAQKNTWHSNPKQSSVFLQHCEEYLSLKDQYPLLWAPVCQAELWEVIGKAPMTSLLPLVDINDTVIRKLFHC